MARPSTAAVRLLAGEREPVLVATTANITLSGLQTIDAVVLTAGDRVLVKDQTDATQNGIYGASAGVWYRAADARSSRTLNKGVTVHVQSGTANSGKVFAQQTLDPDIGDDDIVWGFYISDDLVADAQADINALVAEAEAAELSLDTAVDTATTSAAALIQAIQNAGISILDSLANPVFASKVAAQAHDPDTAPGYIILVGYAAAGDGGGALYKKVGSQPSHPGKIQITEGSWYEVSQDDLDFRAVGALCDGATDDSTALNNARLISQAGKCKRLLLSGTTILNSSTALTFTTGDVEIVGNGPTSVIKAKAAALLVNMIVSNGSNRMALRNLVVDGNNGISAPHANGGTDIGGSGSDFPNGVNSYMVTLDSPDFVMDGVELRYAGSIALQLSVSSIRGTVRNCWFHHNQTCGIFNTGSPAPDRLTIVDNVFSDNYRWFNSRTPKIPDCNAINMTATNFICSRNLFINNYNVNGGQFAFAATSSGLISDNIIRQTSTVVGENTMGIETEGSGIIISNNDIENTTSNGIIASADASDIHIKGNRIYTASGNGVAIIVDAELISVIGNHIRGAGAAAVSVNTTGTDIMVEGNWFEPSISPFIDDPSKVVHIANNYPPAANMCTVAQLPSAATYAGMRRIVSDATAATPGSTVAGGGAVKVPVFSNGTNWIIN